MTLTRTSFLTSGYLVFSFFLLLLGSFAQPAVAGSHRAHGALSSRASAATLSYATVLRGRASWYGRYHQGRRTSSGERFNRFKYTCAHKTLPFGTRLRVTNIANGKSVVVRVSDRGPFRHQRILDLAEVAARPLGIIDQGAATVIAQVVPATTPLGPSKSPRNLGALRAADPDPKAAFTTYQLARPAQADSLAAVASATAPAAASPTPLAPEYRAQASAVSDGPAAQPRQAHLRTLDPIPALELTRAADGAPANRVFISQLDGWLAAETARRRLQTWGATDVVRQVPAPPVVAAVPGAVRF